MGSGIECETMAMQYQHPSIKYRRSHVKEVHNWSCFTPHFDALPDEAELISTNASDTNDKFDRRNR